MQLIHDAELAGSTTLGVGGRARYLAIVESEADLVDALEFAAARGARVWVLGGGSNVVIPDCGLDGLVALMRLRGIEAHLAGTDELLSAAAGEPWDGFVAESVRRGLSGIEGLSGIPGLVGATPIQNVGAYGQEVSETIVQVRAYDRNERRFVELGRDECRFSYRDSLFKSGLPDRFVVTRVRFALSRRAPELRYAELRRHFDAREPTLPAVREAVLAIRRSKSMVVEAGDENRRSCGSFFLNPIVDAARGDALVERLGAASMPRFPQPDGRVKLSAAWLIERAGLKKGTRSGNVGISSRHALALVCHDGASASELLAFAEHVRDVVRRETGIELSPEPVWW
ncbi:MAG: UDP-N-acetylmuramate dehydrogenase [Myxococcota bacterium]|nr:UDP-N-acetylmuramate dehydrogenase [Myxococcota bacterium]